jgi:hypothetical protein
MDKRGKSFTHTYTFFGDTGLEKEIIKESSKNKEFIERN